MIVFLYTIICAAFLKECNAVGGCFGRGCFGAEEFDIDELNYQGDPIRFSCITSETQLQFIMTEINGSIPRSIIDQLDNGRGLSFLFHGVANMVDASFELLTLFAREWFKASENNICIVSYAFSTNSTAGLKMYAVVNKMVKSQRLEYVAKMTRDLVLGVKAKCTPDRSRCLKSLNQVDVSGFSFGAHIAGRTCQYLQQATGEKVRILLAMDPTKTPLFGTSLKNSIKKGDADYVQVIHTSKKVGIWDQMGDVDIYVRYEPEKNTGILSDKRGIALFIHIATASKRLYIWGYPREEGKGSVWEKRGKTLDDEAEIGVHATLNPNHRGKKFGLLLKKGNSEKFWRGIDRFMAGEIFLRTYEMEKEEDIDSECAVCSANKKDTILLPCNHKEICNPCWKSWKQTQERKLLPVTCPVCRTVVRSSQVVKNKK